MVIVTAVALYSYPNFSQRVRVERAIRDLAIDIRTAQQNALSPKEIRKQNGNMDIPRGFGIYLDTSVSNNKIYVFFADMDGNNFFNQAGGDIILKNVTLPQEVTVSELKISSGLTLSSANIVYTVPFSETKIFDSGGAPVLGDSLQVKMIRGVGIERFLTVRTTGLVTLGPLPQNTSTVTINPPSSGDCPGISNIDNSNRWAWNDIVGWIDFCGGTNGNVLVAADRITGFATSSSSILPVAGEGGAPTFDRFGAMALDCGSTNPAGASYCGVSNHGVKNDGSGVLSGWAWLGGGPGSSEASYGWVSFNCSNRGTCGVVPYQVTIDSVTGDFHGFAWNDIIGWIAFNSVDYCSAPSCVSHRVNTLWRPSSTQKLVDLKANANDGLTIPYNTSAILTWHSQNIAVTCGAVSSPVNICWNSQYPDNGLGTTTANLSPGTKCSNLVQPIVFNIGCDCPINTVDLSNCAVNDFVSVNVSSPLSVDLKVDGFYDAQPSATTTIINTSVTLTWSSTSTEYCVANGNWLGFKSLNNRAGQPIGPQPVATTTTYYLDCVASDGTSIRDFVKVRWVNSFSGDMFPPAVSLPYTVEPTFDGVQVSGTVTINALAWDNPVSSVSFILDDVTVLGTDAVSPFAISWNTSTASNGIHTVRARANDAAGNQILSRPLTVRVSN